LQTDIVIVDDNPSNLKLLEDMLLQQGHEVRSFPSGRLALAAALKSPPDLMLLDINMPEMNGYEVCEHLKANPELSDVAVIFLSALNETDDKVKGFQSGGLDYITKPFQFEEVQARVATHLKLHNLDRTLKLQNGHLEEIVAARTWELAEANKRLTILDRSKNEFLRLISHEFRTPLNGLLGAGELILEATPSSVEHNELRELFKRSRVRILSILDDALLLTQIDVNGECFTSAQVSLDAVLNQAILRTSVFAQSREVTLRPVAAELDPVLGDEELLVRAFHALLETAVKFSAKGGTVWLSDEVVPDAVRVIIDTEGRTIPGPVFPNFFDIFSICDPITPGGDLGLAPCVAHRILSLFGASVSVANRDPPGIRLTVSLRHAPQSGDSGPVQVPGAAPLHAIAVSKTHSAEHSAEAVPVIA
jgi:two-component system sensor histidine kinase/response regulator